MFPENGNDNACPPDPRPARFSPTMNYKHLQYFWATAKAGGIVRAGAQLHVTPQTLSTQIKLLESRLGCSLFRKAGRRLDLTDEGRVALRYAEKIFALGAELQASLDEARSGRATVEFRAGIAEACPSPSPTACWSRRWGPRSRCASSATKAPCPTCWRSCR
jgi:DNA-binding transcriptional LysR family regulator